MTRRYRLAAPASTSKLAYHPRNSQDTSSWTGIHAVLVTKRPHRGYVIMPILLYLGWDMLGAHVRIDACDGQTGRPEEAMERDSRVILAGRCPSSSASVALGKAALRWRGVQPDV